MESGPSYGRCNNLSNSDVGDPGDDRVGDGLRRYTCDPNSGGGGPGIFGQASGAGDLGDGGVGDESRRYICDSNDGDRSRSYTCDPNGGTSIGQTSGVGDGSRSQTCNHNDGRNNDSRPGGEASDRDDGRTERRPPRMFSRRTAVPRSTTYDDKRLRDEDGGASDGAAIAGDPDVFDASSRSTTSNYSSTCTVQRFSIKKVGQT